MKFSKTLALVIFLALGWTESNSFANILTSSGTPWEVAILFSGSNETTQFQRDVDRNLVELSQINSGSNLHLSVLREMPDRTVSYSADSTSGDIGKWSELFFEASPNNIQTPGHGETFVHPIGTKTALSTREHLRDFFETAFKDPGAKRILIIYGHGEAFNGLKSVRLRDLRKNLEDTLPSRAEKPLDLLWFDACFMATIEVAYELKGLSNLFMASESAEFSTGVPFESLELLSQGPEDPTKVATELASRFIESYSFLREGSQRDAVLSSSATVSLIDQTRIDTLVKSLSQLTSEFGGKLSPGIRQFLRRSAQGRKVDRDGLTDLGHLLQAMQKAGSVPKETQKQIKQILSDLELTRSSKLRTNPRITLKPGRNGNLVVFGYEGWTKGYAKDAETLEKLPVTLMPQGFLSGPEGKAWPFRKFRRRTLISPFAPGLDRFQYYYVDTRTHQPVSTIHTYTRQSDIFTLEAESTSNPILFSGYTQGVGTAAEKYTGLAILDPSLGDTNIEYIDTDFSRATGWGGF